jgi:hypothetical protein
MHARDLLRVCLDSIRILERPRNCGDVDTFVLTPIRDDSFIDGPLERWEGSNLVIHDGHPSAARSARLVGDGGGDVMHDNIFVTSLQRAHGTAGTHGSSGVEQEAGDDF